MTHEYNNSVAKHYAAFRPALHEVILKRLIMPSEHFNIGLDVGCGTGYSTVALSKYCDQVFGLDPNQAMLDHAEMHSKIYYVNGCGDDFSMIKKNQFDVVCFAGSLFYTKTDKLKSELQRTLSLNGIVIAYDFQIFIDDFITSLGIKVSKEILDYNFEENLRDWPEFTSEIISTDKVNLQFSAEETSHILLANSDRYQAFQKRFHKNEPFDSLTDFIKQQNDKPSLNTEIYFARHYLS